MTQLTESDKAAFRESQAWAESTGQRSPRIVEPTTEARARYCRWATEAAKFYKGTKPVRFVGNQWKL